MCSILCNHVPVDYQVQQTHAARVVVAKGVKSVLECTFHAAYIVRRSADVDFGILRILDAESAFLIVGCPTLFLFAKVTSIFSDRNADLIIVELVAVKSEKLDQVVAEVFSISAAQLVSSLQIRSHQHRQQEGADTSVIGFVEFPALEESLENEDHWLEFRVLFNKELDQFDAVNAVRPVERDVNVYFGVLFLQFYQRHLREFQRLDACNFNLLDESVAQFVEHRQLLGFRVVDKQVDV